MRHAIDPRVDCVFKALLGSRRNRGLLIHFLNAILGEALTTPVVTVTILNPYNEKEFLGDKLSIVDVKAEDQKGNLYQIEIQLLNHRDLPARILYGWADLYRQQLGAGDNYLLLRPAYSIWMLGKNLLADARGKSRAIHHYRMQDQEGEILLDSGGIWVLELNKFKPQEVIKSEQERWLRFFKEGRSLNDQQLPDWMQTPEMKQAMQTLRQFSEKERAYHAYQSRQNYLREQESIRMEMEEYRCKMEENLAAAEAERRAKEEALYAQERERQAKETERQAKEEALAEVDRLKALLNASSTNSEK